MKNFCVIGLLSLFLVCMSCNVISFDDDDVISEPDESAAWFDGETVNFKFSCAVQHYYAEESVMLKSGNSQYSLSKSWKNERTLAIKPEEGWVKGRIYQASLNGTMYKNSGAIFSAYTVTTFRYGDKNCTFNVIDMPKSELDCATDYSFSFEFNKKISKLVFEECFSISPSVEYKIDVDDSKQKVTVSPKNKWATNTLYSWEIRSLKSIDNWELQQNLTNTFQTAIDYESPVLEKICPVTDASESAIWFEEKNLNELLSGKMPIGFVFSKTMDFTSVKNSISFSPSINGYFLQADKEGKRFLYVPEDFYALGKKYVVTVSNTARDTNNLRLYREVKESFTSTDKYLELKSVRFDATDVENWTVSPVVHKISNNSIYIMLTFSESIEEYKLASVSGSISLSLLFPMSSKSPVKTEVSWNKDRNVLTLGYSNLTVKSSDQTTYYRLKLLGGKSGINTGTGIYLREDICINIQPE